MLMGFRACQCCMPLTWATTVSARGVLGFSFRAVAVVREHCLAYPVQEPN